MGDKRYFNCTECNERCLDTRVIQRPPFVTDNMCTACEEKYLNSRPCIVSPDLIWVDRNGKIHHQKTEYLRFKTQREDAT
jgi:hypothetical protein